MVATVTPINTSAIKLNRLLQLCSANLPVGGFSFSQGLEYAVECGWLTSAEQTESWIRLNLEHALAQTDLAIIKRIYATIENHDLASFERWNQHIIACRESNELLLADLAMGKALMRLLNQLNGIDVGKFESLFDIKDISFVSSFTLAAYLFDIDLYSAQSGFCWAFIDNQVAAATKLVPLGQTQAQNLLFSLSETIDQPIALANQIADHQIGASLPNLVMASAWHETQYSRLFRS